MIEVTIYKILLVKINYIDKSITFIVLFSHIYRYKRLWKPGNLIGLPDKSDCRDIEHALMISIRHALPASEKSLCCQDNLLLLLPVYTVLWRGLNALPAALYLYKMYTLRIIGYNVYLKMPAPPVPFQNRMPLTAKEIANSLLSEHS